MSKRTIDDVEYVADAMILGHLRAAAINYEYAHKEFKRHHYDMRDLAIAQTFEIVRQLSERTLREFCEFCNKKVRDAQEERVRREMNLSRKRRSKDD